MAVHSRFRIGVVAAMAAYWDATTSAHPQRGLGASSAIVERWSPESDSFVAVSAPGGTPL
jgi:hypothetical protein